jgi:hypothetical protein
MQRARGATVRTLPVLVAYVVCAALLVATTPAVADSAPELKILAIDPAPDALLARQQPFYVRFELQNATPAAVTVSGLYKGKAVIDDGGTGAPALLPANGGTGVVSFFYWGEKPTRIDEVRLKISEPQSGATIKEYKFPVALTWLTDDPPPREPAAWVKDWQQAQQAARGKTARVDGPSAEPTTASTVLLALAAVAVLMAIAVAWWRRRSQPPKKY